MQLNIMKEVAAMKWMTMKDLREKYAEAFGEGTNANNRAWLIRRIAWRLQAKAEGDLSERARRRAAELANEADLRLNPPAVKDLESGPADRTTTDVLPLRADDRLPPPGTVITRNYKGEALQVRVLEHGFEFEGEVFASLSAVARKITGSHCNGFHFFKLGKEAV
jgi:hypothetical protein